MAVEASSPGAVDGMAPGTVIPITARWRERRPLASAPRRSERRRPELTITPTPIRTTLRRHRRPAAITPILPATEARDGSGSRDALGGVRIARVDKGMHAEGGFIAGKSFDAPRGASGPCRLCCG